MTNIYGNKCVGCLQDVRFKHVRIVIPLWYGVNPGAMLCSECAKTKTIDVSGKVTVKSDGNGINGAGNRVNHITGNI